MIRREPAPDEPADSWILIPQMAHAALAADLAQHWGEPPVPQLEPRDPLLWAVAHHDDGWEHWDAAPQFDPATGRPRSFTEMALAESFAIWSASIDRAERRGPLEAYLIAGHFCALAERATAFSDSARREKARPFLDRYNGLKDRWLAAWTAQSPQNTADRVRRALAQLQMFDALSLWLCCSRATESEELITPGGPAVTLNPEGGQLVRLDPWPLRVSNLSLSVEARLIPKSVRSAEQMALAAAQSLQLRWELAP
jgi:hypothetical protein